MPLTIGIGSAVAPADSAKLRASMCSQMPVALRRRMTPAGPARCASSATSRIALRSSVVTCASCSKTACARCSSGPWVAR